MVVVVVYWETSTGRKGLLTGGEPEDTGFVARQRSILIWKCGVQLVTVTISQIRSASRNSAAEQQVLLGPLCAKCRELRAQIRGWCTFSRLRLTGEFCLRIRIRWRSIVRCTCSRALIFAGAPATDQCKQEYMRTRVCNTTHWGLARRNFK